MRALFIPGREGASLMVTFYQWSVCLTARSGQYAKYKSQAAEAANGSMNDALRYERVGVDVHLKTN